MHGIVPSGNSADARWPPVVLRVGAAAAALLAALLAVGSTSDAWGAMRWAVIAAFGSCAYLRSREALILLAVYAPFGGALSAFFEAPAPLIDAAALAASSGWLAATSVRPARAPQGAVSALFALMAAIILASVAAQIWAAWQLLGPAGFGPFELAWRFLVGQTRGLPSLPFGPEVPAARRALAGLGIGLMAFNTVLEDRAAIRPIARMLVAATAGMAALNLNRFLEVVLRQGTDWLTALPDVHSRIRVSATITDVNAAGALLVLVLPPAAELAFSSRPLPRLGWALAAGTVGASLWLTGSRAAMLGGVLSLLLWLAFRAHRSWTVARTVVVLGMAGAVVVALAIWYPRGAAHTPSASAWEIRRELAAVAFAITAEHPVFGAGIGRFFDESRRLASPTLRRSYAAENAHNQFLQVLGELGIAGLSVFVVLVGLCLGGRIPAGSDRTHAALVSGVVGFLAASLLMHPLLVPEASITFWIVLGAVGALTQRPAAVSPRRLVVTLGLGAVLTCSVPWRGESLAAGTSLDGVGLGLSRWRMSTDGAPYRVSRGASAVFIDAHAKAFRLPLRVVGGPTTVILVLDGNEATRAPLMPQQWTDVAMLLPPAPARRRSRLLEIRWTPTNPRHRIDVGRVEYPHDRTAQSPER